MAARHGALADLSFSFPALLFALASSRDAARVGAAVAAVVSGRSLRECAAIAGLPMWLRALPQEAFVQPLPQLPDGPLFARRVANHLPREARHAALWLWLVGEAARWGDEAISGWVAQEFSRAPGKAEWGRLKLVCLWAFLTGRPGTAAAQLSRKRWSPRMTFARAVEEARDWMASLELVCVLNGREAFDGWLRPAVVDDYAFVPLATHAAIAEEARGMENCLRTYGWRLVDNSCRLWSVRRGETSVATVELGAPCSGGRIVSLVQASARNNGDISPEVERTIHAWLRAQPITEAPPEKKINAMDGRVWRSLFRPYWLAKRTLPDWLPLTPSYDVLQKLVRGPRQRRVWRRVAIPRAAGMI